MSLSFILMHRGVDFQCSNSLAFFRWGTLTKMQLMLRKASNTLYVNGKMTFDQMHNYRMAVTEREVINGCLSVGPDHKYWCISFTLQECYMRGFL